MRNKGHISSSSFSLSLTLILLFYPWIPNCCTTTSCERNFLMRRYYAIDPVSNRWHWLHRKRDMCHHDVLSWRHLVKTTPAFWRVPSLAYSFWFKCSSCSKLNSLSWLLCACRLVYSNFLMYSTPCHYDCLSWRHLVKTTPAFWRVSSLAYLFWFKCGSCSKLNSLSWLLCTSWHLVCR